MKRMMMITAMTSFCFILAVLSLNPGTEQHWCDGGGEGDACVSWSHVFLGWSLGFKGWRAVTVREMAAFGDQNIAF